MPKFGEKPTSVNRERFDKNRESSEDVKKQIAEATASGDMDKVIELAGQIKTLKAQEKEFKGQDEAEAYEENAKIEDHGEALEMNKQFDEAKAAEEEARKKAEIAEQDKLKAEEEAAKLTEIRAKIQGGGGEDGLENEDTRKFLDEALKFESEGNFFYAATSFEKSGNRKKALENWEKSAQELEKEGNTIGSAEHYEKAGNIDASNKMFEAYAKKLESWGSFDDAERIRKERIRKERIKVKESNQEEIKPELKENTEQKEKSPEEKQYEFFKGTLEFDESGNMKRGIFHVLRDNPIVMLEAYKKNPKNLRLLSKRLSEDPEFVKQLAALGAKVEKDGSLSKNADTNHFDDVDKNEKPTRESFEKARLEAVAFNLARGSRSLEEMGVDKDFALSAIKDGIIADLKNFFGNGTNFNNAEQIKKAMEAVGGNIEEIRNDPEVRKAIIENAIPRFCSHIAGDRTSAEWVGKLISNLSETFNVTKDDWEKAMTSPWGGNSVRDYYYSQRRS